MNVFQIFPFQVSPDDPAVFESLSNTAEEVVEILSDESLLSTLGAFAFLLMLFLLGVSLSRVISFVVTLFMDFSDRREAKRSLAKEGKTPDKTKYKGTVYQNTIQLVEGVAESRRVARDVRRKLGAISIIVKQLKDLNQQNILPMESKHVLESILERDLPETVNLIPKDASYGRRVDESLKQLTILEESLDNILKEGEEELVTISNIQTRFLENKHAQYLEQPHQLRIEKV